MSLGIILGFVLGLALSSILLNQSGKTRRYRRSLTDLYVAGKVRQIAKKDGIDIAEEYEVFKKYMKKHRIEDQSLDNTIEEDLQERITEKDKKDMKEIK